MDVDRKSPRIALRMGKLQGSVNRMEASGAIGVKCPLGDSIKTEFRLEVHWCRQPTIRSLDVRVHPGAYRAA